MAATLAALGVTASERPAPDPEKLVGATVAPAPTGPGVPASVGAGTARDAQSGSSAGAVQVAAVDFLDRRLREALEEALGKESGAAISGAEMATLQSLDASGRRIANLAGLEHATNLAALYLDRNDITDISPLASLPRLAHLDLDDNPVYDPGPLAGLTQLSFLGLANTKVRDLSPLTGLFRLEWLRVGGPLLSELTPLVEIPRLRSLQIRAAPHARFEVLSRMTQLEQLELVDTGVVDLAPLASLTRLVHLILSGNPVKDLGPLAGLSRVGSLNLSHARISDITPLARMRNLAHLLLAGNAVSDISVVRGMKRLRLLDVADNAVSDISALAGLERLWALYMQRNEIADLSALAGLTELTRIDAWENSITDLSPLAENEALASGTWINVLRNPLDAESVRTHVPVLRDRGATVLWRSDASFPLRYQALVLPPPEARDAFVSGDYFSVFGYRRSLVPFDCEGTFELELDIGGQSRFASSGYGVHPNSVFLTYFITDEDYDADGIRIPTGTLHLTEGDCPVDGLPWTFALAGYSDGDDPDLKVDGTIDLPARIDALSVSPPAVGDRFSLGEPIVVTAAFNEPVMVEGAPRIRLNVGGRPRLATLRQREPAALHFEYRVARGDMDGDGITFDDPLRMQGGWIRDRGRNVVDLDLPPSHDRSRYRVHGATADATPPTVAGVAVDAWRDRWPVPGDQALRQNDRLEIRIEFSEYVEVDDAATLALDIGRETRRIILAKAAGNGLYFNYFARAGDLDTNGIGIPRDALSLSEGAAIRDASGNVATLDLGVHALPDGAGRRVRGGGRDSRPTIVSANFAHGLPRHGARGIGAGESMLFVIRYDESVSVDVSGGAPSAEVRLGAVKRVFDFVEPGGIEHYRRDLVFEYVVQPADRMALRAGVVDAEYGSGVIRLNGARIRDRGGNPADLSYPPGFEYPAWYVNGAFESPPVPEAESGGLEYTTFASNPGPDGSFGRDEIVDIPVRFSEPVHVRGDISLPLRIGSGTRAAEYVGGGGSRRLLFRYRVRPGDLGRLELRANRVVPDADGAIVGGRGEASPLVGGIPTPDGFGASWFVNGSRDRDTAVPPLAGPSGVVVDSGPGELAVSWDPLGEDLNGDAPVTGYVAVARSSGGERYSCTAGAGQTACVIEGLDIDATYNVTVHAMNGVGRGIASPHVAAVTGGQGSFWRGWRLMLPRLVRDAREE